MNNFAEFCFKYETHCHTSPVSKCAKASVEETVRFYQSIGYDGLFITNHFLDGNINPESAEMVRRAVSLGCEIENHSVTHPFMDKLSVEEIREEVQTCTDRIVEITGRVPQFFRPPCIAVSQAMYDNIDLTFICGMGCEDWVPTVTTQERIDRVLANAADGQIVLLHDMEWNVNTVEALKTIVPELKKRGYEFATVSQIFKMKNVTPQRGWLYSNVLQTESDNRL